MPQRTWAKYLPCHHQQPSKMSSCQTCQLMQSASKPTSYIVWGQAPTLYDTSGNINSVFLAWQEWNSGPAQTTIAQRVLEIKAHKHMSMGRRNVHLHKTNRHLPQLIESLIGRGATPVQAVSLLTHIADHFQLTLDHMREGARLLSGKTAKGNSDRLTAETTVTLGQFKAALGWAYAQVTSIAATRNL